MPHLWQENSQKDKDNLHHFHQLSLGLHLYMLLYQVALDVIRGRQDNQY